MIKLLGERILIKKIEEEEQEEVKQTESGIYLVGDDPNKKGDTTQYYIEAKVEATGNECKNVSQGDGIIFDKRAGVDIKIEGETYQMFNESNIIAITSRVVE